MLVVNSEPMVPGGSNAASCQAALPGVVPSRSPDHGDGGVFGGFHRKSPTGGWAKGMLRNTQTEVLSSWMPWMAPCWTWRTGWEVDVMFDVIHKLQVRSKLKIISKALYPYIPILKVHL